MIVSRPRHGSRIPGGRALAMVLVGSFGLAAVLAVRSNATVLVESYPRMDSYRTEDARTIVVTVAVAPRSWTRVTSIGETATAVRVTVESLTWPLPLPGTAGLVLQDLTISLAGDLATRVVVDAADNPVPVR